MFGRILLLRLINEVESLVVSDSACFLREFLMLSSSPILLKGLLTGLIEYEQPHLGPW